MNGRNNLMKRIRSLIPLYFLIILLLFVLSIILHLLSTFFTPIADALSKYACTPVRAILASVTSVFSFSLAEALLIFSPVLFAALIYKLVRDARVGDRKSMRGTVFFLASVLLSVYILFVFTIGITYHTTTLDKRLSLEREKVSASELSSTALVLVDGIEQCLSEMDTGTTGSTRMPYRFSELSVLLNTAYEKADDKYDFIGGVYSKVKPVILSEPMTYTHISGVYSFFTGEANVNTNYPDYIIPFTAAHEMAHQRGIAREDEANFVAFLICTESDNAYVRYSGYTQILEYTLSALAAADREAYKKVYSALPDRYRSELSSFSTFMKKYEKSVVSSVSSAVNDTYQQLQGQTAGVKSYGLVVDLAVAYYKNKGLIGG